MQRSRDAGGDASRPLSTARRGDRVVVVSFDGAPPHERHKLMALGILPGSLLSVLQRHPAFVIAAGYTQFALDRETAASILVRSAE